MYRIWKDSNMKIFYKQKSEIINENGDMKEILKLKVNMSFHLSKIIGNLL